jgi:serine/threonine-protein kinase
MLSAREVAPGVTLAGRFLLLEEKARGGMSVVFKAEDLEQRGGHGIVAVKVPLPEYASGIGAWSMFQQEAENGARLRHPSIVRFVPFDGRSPALPEPGRKPVADARGIVVMEYVEGVPLASRIGRGRRLGEAEALQLASSLCDAIGYMHGEGIVHYDVSPRNVILREDGSPCLIDLGLTHALDDGPLAFTRPAPAVATAAYAAPEQIRRQRGRPSVDVYALGAILYEMLTGHPPFEGDDPFSVASARWIGDPTRPRAYCPEVSLEVEEIVLRALRRDPRERYRSAAQMKADIDRPAQVRVTGLASRLVEVTPWRRRRRWMAYIAFVALTPLGFLAGLFLLLWWHFAHMPAS